MNSASPVAPPRSEVLALVESLPIEAIEGGSGPAEAVALVVEVPPEKIVLFQALLELYEELGIVRTIDRERSAVALITLPHQVPDLRNILAAEWDNLGLRLPVRPAKGWVVLGAGKKGKDENRNSQ